MRVYCYFSFSEHYGYVTDSPIASADLVPKMANNVRILRQIVLREVISFIWRYEPEALESVQRVAMLYMSSFGGRGELFHHIQTRKCLRFLGMDEVLSEPNAHVSVIQCTPAVENALRGLQRVYRILEPYGDPYSRYAQIKTAKMIHDIAEKLPEKYKWNFIIPSMREIAFRVEELISENPDFLSAYLYMAGLCKHIDPMRDREEAYYAHILQRIPVDSRHYAFVWYRLGKLYEKKYHDHRMAKKYYNKAIEVDRNYYQALFKLGHYAAIEARYDEAEMFLLQTLRSIFHRVGSQRGEEEFSDNWNYLTQKEIQYAFKTYILLAKIAIKTNREYSAKAFIDDVCIAALAFERAKLINSASTESEFYAFWKYHRLSEPVWAMWKVLEPWTEDIIYDYYVRDIVREKLKQWSPLRDETEENGTIRYINRMDV